MGSGYNEPHVSNDSGSADNGANGHNDKPTAKKGGGYRVLGPEMGGDEHIKQVCNSTKQGDRHFGLPVPPRKYSWFGPIPAGITRDTETSRNFDLLVGFGGHV